MLIALLIPLSLAVVLYAFVLLRSAVAQGAVPKPEAIVLGSIVNFFERSASARSRRPRPGSSSAGSFPIG